MVRKSGKKTTKKATSNQTHDGTRPPDAEEDIAMDHIQPDEPLQSAPVVADGDPTHSLRQGIAGIRRELAKVIVGQEQVVEQLLVALLARGHCLLEGVPGLAKTLLVSSLARVLSLPFKRIQFTPDLMPADILGTEVIHEDRERGERVFRFLRGPIFTSVLLADEINRTPPKTQAALLEAMQERQVTVGGTLYPMTDPFFVLATQNPVDQEGTYPLPEAQRDRFLFMVRVDYPDADEELRIMQQTSTGVPEALTVQAGADDILHWQRTVRDVPAADHILKYCRAMVRCTRPNTPEAPPFINEWVAWGAGPRASMYLVLAAKAHALLRGRSHASWEDVVAVAHPVLRHRVILNFAARSEGIDVDTVISRVLEHIPQKEQFD